MITNYHMVFRRKLPAGYKEVEVCEGCGAEDEPCRCIDANVAYCAVRIDGKPNTLADKRLLFPEKYDALH